MFSNRTATPQFERDHEGIEKPNLKIAVTK